MKRRLGIRRWHEHLDQSQTNRNRWASVYLTSRNATNGWVRGGQEGVLDEDGLSHVGRWLEAWEGG